MGLGLLAVVALLWLLLADFGSARSGRGAPNRGGETTPAGREDPARAAIAVAPEDSAPASGTAFVLEREDAAVLTLRLVKGCRLAGRVLDERGQPVAEVAVRAGPSPIWGPGAALGARTVSDSEGRYELTDLPSGTLQVAPGDSPVTPMFVE